MGGRGAAGTRHLQGFVHLERPMTFRAVQELLMIPPHVHFEVARGSDLQNKEYCSKGENVFECGTTPRATQQDRRDERKAQHREAWYNLMQDITMDPFASLSSYHEFDYIKLIAQNGRWFAAFQQDQQLKRAQQLRNVSACVLWGPTGTGKTYTAMQTASEADLEVFLISIVSERHSWFDGYRGQKVLIIDEFDPNVVDKTLMKRLLDKYPLRLPVKGGFTYANWDKVVLTSNYDPKTWYQNQEKADYDAIQRRITHTVHMTEPYHPE